MSRTLRYLLVAILSFPLALGVRYVLGRVMQEDLPTATKAYVRSRKEQPLSEPLAKILTDRGYRRAAGKTHELLDRPAPDFTLADDRGALVRLNPGADNRPVVLVFYLGYNCIHCVAQLFALNEDIGLFQECGSRVIAVSDDAPEHTAAQFKQYGRFQFSVLSDADNKVAQAYGVYRPALGERSELHQHGTFLIGMDGRVFWADVGAEPFLDNKTLLIEIARHTGLDGRLETVSHGRQSPRGAD